MASSPLFKIYRNGVYEGCLKFPGDADAVLAAWGEGQIRYGHAMVVWEEGSEDQPASESFDHVAEVVYSRLSDGQMQVAEKMQAQKRSTKPYNINLPSP